MRLSARGAQKTRDESKKLQMYSKQWSPGDTLRVFYPIFWEDGKPEIAVGALWGHSVSDIKGLGLRTAFIPSTTQFDENANPIGTPDITYQFSQIARIFVSAAKAREEAAIMNKNFPTENARKEALKTIEDKYDTKNNQNAVKPIIGKAQYYISTEVLSVKIVNGVPNEESIVVSSAPLSNKTIRALYALLDDPKYAPTEGDAFFEVEWKYPMNQKKGESAKDAAPQGLTSEYRLVNQFAATYGKLTGFFETVSRDSESIVRRATTFIDPAKVRTNLQQWAFLNSEDLDGILDEDKETLFRHVELVKELDLLRAVTNPELIEELKAEITKYDASARVEAGAPVVNTEAPSTPTANSEPQVTPESTVAPNLMEQVPGAPSIESLLSNPNLAGDSDLDMEQIDLSASV